MTSTADLVMKILPEAIAQVSDGGHMVFSMRNLFYAVRQLFLTQFSIDRKYGFCHGRHCTACVKAGRTVP